jgi:class 3 adenylate cyclase/tetratricopeptide (TPR) repeat protein
MERRSERRLVTCVFIDLVGSTDLGQRLGPERMQRLLTDSFREISAIATAAGGTIEKYIGDEVFVLFGAPVAHSDDVVRALHVAEASVRWASTSPSPVSVRVGIETGEALVDLEGVGERQRMAVGSCVNIAARLMTRADPNTVVVGPITFAAANQAAEFDDLGPLELKGLGPVPAWRLKALTNAREGQLPLVGRDSELGRLRTLFERAARGDAALAILTGPPGIGKTRISEEFARSVAAEAKVLEARCRPGTEVGSSPLRQLLANADPERVPPAVTHSAGLRSDARVLALNSADRRTAINSAWKEYLADLSRARPVVICIEDLHWAESELIRLIDGLTLASSLRLMVLATARPEFPGMPLLRPSEDRLFLELQPLDPASASALAQAAGARGVDIDRAEGHPLFIVELARARGSAGTALPLTVQAAISARLDELLPADRELLQSSSVIGETFDVRGAALLAEREPSDIAGALGRLAHLRYVQPIDGRFRFQHALVRDIAYGRLPIGTRLRLHAQYAREGLRPDDVETLAHHWWQALGPDEAAWVWEGDPEREAMRGDGLRAHLAAGARLGDRLAFERTSEIFRRALKLAASPLEQAQVEAAFGLACARNAKGDEATEHRLRAIELYREAEALPPVSLYADTLDLPVFNWGYFQHMRTLEEIVGLIDEGISNAREQSDSANLLRLLVQKGVFLNSAEVLPEISRLLESGADLSTRADALWRLALMHFSVTEDMNQALSALDLAFRLAAGGAAFNLPEALMWRSTAFFHAGDLERSDADADRLLDVSRPLSPHTRQHALGTKARVLLGRGDWAGVIEQADALRSLFRDYPDDNFCLIGASGIADGATAQIIEAGRVPEDLESLMLRLIPESPPIRAATLLVPVVMSSGDVAEDDAHRAYARETPIFEREQIWDLTETHWAIAGVVRQQWKELEPLVARLDGRAGRGSKFAGALAAALREEMAAARGGPRPKHEALRGLGYNGISQLVSYRVPREVRDTLKP